MTNEAKKGRKNYERDSSGCDRNNRWLRVPLPPHTGARSEQREKIGDPDLSLTSVDERRVFSFLLHLLAFQLMFHRFTNT